MAKAVLADWFDNSRIDRLYPLHCYGVAIDAIPSEFRDSTDADEVIARAFQAASGERLGLAPPLDTSASARSTIPLPPLVLAAISIALLAAGGLGYASRRRRSQTDDPGDKDVHL